MTTTRQTLLPILTAAYPDAEPLWGDRDSAVITWAEGQTVITSDGPNHCVHVWNHLGSDRSEPASTERGYYIADARQCLRCRLCESDRVPITATLTDDDARALRIGRAVLSTSPATADNEGSAIRGDVGAVDRITDDDQPRYLIGLYNGTD